jgi:hypothetical protein
MAVAVTEPATDLRASVLVVCPVCGDGGRVVEAPGRKIAAVWCCRPAHLTAAGALHPVRMLVQGLEEEAP